MNKFKKILYKFLFFFPTKLPTGFLEFTKFEEQILIVYDLPSLPSYRQAIATMIMHLPPTVFNKPKRFFALSVKKAQANQVAYEMIQQAKEEQIKLEAQQNKSEAISTTNDGAPPNEPIPDKGI